MSSQEDMPASQIANMLARLNTVGSAGDSVEHLPFIGFLINKAAQSVVARSDALLEPFGINSRHYGILYVIVQEPGLPQKAIGEKLRIDRTTMVKLVDDLEKLGLVQRQKDPNDRRAYALSLSALGEEKLPDISQHVQQAEALILASLTPEEIQQLLAILIKLL